MGGVVGAITGKKKRSQPKPAPAQVQKAKAEPRETKQSSVTPSDSAKSKQAITAGSGRSQLVTGRSNTATRGGVAIPR